MSTSVNRETFGQEELTGMQPDVTHVFAPLQLLSLLLEALLCPDEGVQLSTLSCLQPVFVEPPAAVIQQLEALFSRLLTLTSSPSMVSITACVVRQRVQPLVKEGTLVEALQNTMIDVNSRSIVHLDHQRAATTPCFFSSVHLSSVCSTVHLSFHTSHFLPVPPFPAPLA